MTHKLIRQAETNLPTRFGTFKMIGYAEESDNPMPHLAMVSTQTDLTKPVLVRIHSECMTGDVFGSLRCDCGEQLDQSMMMTGKDGGVVIYLRQEGRGIGLINKMKAYNLQDQGLNTAEANVHLGFEIDERDYSIAIEILRDLGVTSVLLMTNNPDKLESLKKSGVEVLGRVPIEIKPHQENLDYLQTKQNLMGHLLDISK
ncbi:GTP cyclohydrolase II [Catalinimonas alkaloidigena]|uniref:GTP cyclohydrolase II n=1 Tax=Catalinimonas alkaloidigena TaxID=1075417 RepID=UPI002406476D|nr:GTP cyclohydrolase II [Catalinimonas alkaloidigena]MDF9795644.1 GTP cyclohydrolase II [Catalinimonas alkaloidigena]